MKIMLEDMAEALPKPSQETPKPPAPETGRLKAKSCQEIAL